MPYTPKQRRLFNAMANNPSIAREHHASAEEADKLADEANRLKKEGKEKAKAFIDLSGVIKPYDR